MNSSRSRNNRRRVHKELDFIDLDRDGIISEEEKLAHTAKPYVQFSKRMISFLIGNLIVIELFVMFMVVKTYDMTPVPYLVTSIAATLLGGVIWYMKNSEAEKKARISAEIEKFKIAEMSKKALVETVNKSFSIEDEPDTYFRESEDPIQVDQLDIIDLDNAQG